MNTLPIKKIMVATDFSPSSQKAREYAHWLAEKIDAELHVVHVFDSTAIQIPAPYYFLIGVEKWLDENVGLARKRSKELLDKIKQEEGENCHIHFTEGKPGAEIVAQAEKLDAGMIVLGTHGYTGLDRLVMGSVAEWVTRHSTCPVFCVRVPDQT